MENKYDRTPIQPNLIIDPSLFGKEVISVGGPVTKEQLMEHLEVWERVKRAEDKSKTTTTIVDAWEKQQSQDRELKNRFGWFILILLAIQVVAIFVILFLQCFGVISRP